MSEQCCLNFLYNTFVCQKEFIIQIDPRDNVCAETNQNQKQQSKDCFLFSKTWRTCQRPGRAATADAAGVDTPLVYAYTFSCASDVRYFGGAKSHPQIFFGLYVYEIFFRRKQRKKEARNFEAMIEKNFEEKVTRFLN